MEKEKTQTPEQRSRIEQIASFQAITCLSDTEFSKHLPFSATTWNRLKGNTYEGDITKKVDEASQSAQVLQETWTKSREKEHVRKFYDFTIFRAVFQAVKTAKIRSLSGEEDKLIVYSAPSGWGKTHLAHELQSRLDAKIVTARQSWRRSYFSACKAIARSVGLQMPFRGAAEAEEALIDHLALHPSVIVLNEVEFFSRDILNLIKTILNETKCSVVMLTIPEFFASIKVLGGLHTDQLLRRCVAVLSNQVVTQGQAAKFLGEEFEVDDALKPALKSLAHAANHSPSGGPGYGYKLLQRVVEHLAEEFTRDSPPSPADVEHAINVYQRTLSL